jgi:photosystem II stability/assembly factor-like uncharacterized protein
MSYLSRRLCLALASYIVFAQAAAGPAAQAPPDPAAAILDRLTFRSLGPAVMGGRVDDLAVLETRPSVIFAGFATGGLWKSLNDGTTWEAVFDRQETASIGAVAIPRDDAALVWVGTGENNNRQSSSWGSGIFKSTDGGKSWKNAGLADSRHIGRIVIDPLDHDVVYVAATGHLWGPNKERGVYKTVDGGTTWTQVLFVDEQTGATDLVMDPSDPKVLYAAMYQRQRSAWGFNGGGPESGLFKSVDAGKSWIRLTAGIPEGSLGRIGLDIYRRNPKVVFALIQHATESGLYRSEDAGAHWTKISATNPRPLYFSQVRIDPGDERRIYVLGVRLMVSDDGGRTFREVRVAFTRPGGERPRDDLDVHALWIDPRDTAHLIIGSDVGVAASYDRGAAWDYIDNLPVGQFYHVGYDMDVPYRVYGGLQDNDVWGGPSATRNRFGIGNRDWFTLSIGDGFVALSDPRDARILYCETQDGSIVRINRETGERKNIRPLAARGEPQLRWAWDTPLIISPHDANTILIAANRIFRSRDRGDSWDAISPDLTSGVDRETLALMGVIGKDIRIAKNDGVSAYPAIVTLAESPKRAGLYYAGADDGTVRASRDGGKTWADLSRKFPGLPERAAARRIAASAFDEAAAYAVFNNHAADDYAPYVYATKDYGATWASLAATLPPGETVNCITEDPKNAHVLYLGTESGLFVTLDQGLRWTRLKNNLPTVPVDEITIHPRQNDMLLATHGRSLWILDNIAPIQEAAEAVISSVYLFDVAPALQFAPTNDFAGYPGDRKFWGQNPDPGAAIAYFLKEAPKGVSIMIRDGRGRMVREFSADELSNSRNAGYNRILWDLRHQPLEAARNLPAQRPGGAPGGGAGGRGGGGGGALGPFVFPGEYLLTIAADGHEAGSRPLTVIGDPMIRISASDRRLHHDTALLLHELQRTANEAAAALGAAGDQIRAAQDRIKSSDHPPAAVASTAESLAKRLDSLAGRLGGSTQPPGGRGAGSPESTAIRSQIGTLKNQLMAWTEAPTGQRLKLARASREQIVSLIAELNEVTTKGLPALHRMMSDGGIQMPPVPPIPPVKIPGPPG